MQRLPIRLVGNVQLPAALGAASYTTPGNSAIAGGSVTTISAATFFNTNAAPVSVTCHVIPPAGAPTNANMVFTGLQIPPVGSAPTIVSALIGMHLPVGYGLFLYADTATSITPIISGYITTP